MHLELEIKGNHELGANSEEGIFKSTFKKEICSTLIS